MRRFMGKHSLNVKVVKDQPNEPTDPNRDPFEGVELAAAYSEVAKDFITHVAFTVGGVMAGYQIIKRICK